MGKFIKTWTLETPVLPGSNTVNMRDFEYEPTQEDVDKFVEDAKISCGTIFVKTSWQFK